jgi:hypothetical protein
MNKNSIANNIFLIAALMYMMVTGCKKEEEKKDNKPAEYLKKTIYLKVFPKKWLL